MATMKSKYNQAKVGYLLGKDNLVRIEVDLDYILQSPSLLRELKMYLRQRDTQGLLDIDYMVVEQEEFVYKQPVVVRFQIRIHDYILLEEIVENVLKLVEEAAE
jgi:hypothetical protein